jgi:hypothetical protein
VPEGRSGWGTNQVFDLHMGRGVKPELVTIEGHPETPPIDQGDDQKYHTDDWLKCMRNRGVPNGNIQTGFGHAVAVVMANRAYQSGRKVYWDRKNEQIMFDQPA